MDIEAVRSRVAEAMDQVERLRAGYADLYQGLRAVTATATSEDGMVTVTVGPQGRVTSIDLDPRIYRRPDSRRLAQIITATIGRAAEEAESKVRRLCAPYMPDEEIMAHLSGSVPALLNRHEGELIVDAAPAPWRR